MRLSRLCDTETSEPSHWIARALIDEQLGNRGDAASGLMQALALGATDADLSRHLARIVSDSGEIAQVDQYFQGQLRSRPQWIEGWARYGEFLIALRRDREGAECFNRALRIGKNRADLCLRFARALSDQGYLKEAAGFLHRAVEFEPESAEVYITLGHVYGALHGLHEAETQYREAIAQDPDCGQSFVVLGSNLIQQRRFLEAKDVFERALRFEPLAPIAHANLGYLSMNLGSISDAITHYRAAIGLAPDFQEAHSALLLALNYQDDLPAETVYQAHREWARRLEGGVEAYSGHRNTPDTDRRLRVGYVSPDFRTHSVSYFLEPLLKHTDPASQQHFFYSNSSKADVVTRRLEQLGVWRTIVERSDEEVAAMVRADQIDILVDLAGHTGCNRLGVFARKPAPIQVTWLGYPNTTGLSAMDYRLTDVDVDPEPAADRYHTERLLRLPHGFLCYRPPAETPAVAPPPIEKHGHVTFGSFNQLAKVSPAAREAWASLLKNVPRSRLLVKASAFSEASTCARFRQSFEALGVDPERIETIAWSPYRSNHLRQYQHIDIALDTFPYQGTTTTCEALWMGVPVVVLAGDRHVRRVGVSLLRRIGLEELVADNVDAYVGLAGRLAQDPARLRGLREGLRPRLQGSALCDGSLFACDVDRAYRRAWADWCLTQTGARHP